MELGAFTPAQGVIAVLEALLDYGEEVSPRNLKTKEIRNVSLNISNPWSIPFDLKGRKLSQRIAALEICSLIGQTPADAFIMQQTMPLVNYMDDGIAYGNYGVRIRNQLQQCFYLLTDDPATRQAVISIYDGARDLGKRTRDTPCTVAIQFFIRHKQLEMRVTMRSNDAWLGLPYDLMQFAALQCALAQVLDIEPGHYIHTVGSLHLYELHYGLARDVMLDHDSKNNGYCSWSANTLSRLVFNAQCLLYNYPLDNVSAFELWLRQTLHGEEVKGW